MASTRLHGLRRMGVEVSTGLIPETETRYQRYNNSAKGKTRRVQGRLRESEQSLQRYLDRRFIAWDGEGGNEPDGSHTYFLLSSSDGHSLARRDGLRTADVFDLWIKSKQPDTTNIGYGLGYDINMVLRDLDRNSLETLYRCGRVKWNDYRIEWRAGKSFRVGLGPHSFLLYDVLPFFQRTFVAACDEYLGDDWECRDEIVAGKLARGSFDWSQINEVTRYNGAELRNLVRLADELRQRLHKVEIRVSRWDGPGAIASALYKKYETKSYLDAAPPEVAEAGRYAYAGGRFEIIRKGHSVEGAWQYDIRSAYPSAIRYLPCLVHGHWTKRIGPIRRLVQFGIYRIEVCDPPTESITQPQPLWMRNRDGTVYFSEYSHGWYWSPEAELALELGGSVIHEAWEWVQDCDHEPFNFVEALYNKRAALKKAGDGAHVGLKLGLNSLYGKLAQQIGWDAGPPLKLPPYHSLEWAGWITAHCRAQVYRAAMHAPDDVIAFETDAIFSRVPLPLDIGSRLGQWECTEYSSLTYLKSGMYFGTLTDGTEVEKTRGINKGSITRQQMIEALETEQRGEVAAIHAEQTRFVGLGQALNQDFNKWRRWYTDPRILQVALNGKRIDLLDARDSRKDIGDGWRETQEGLHETDFSHPYEVAWIKDSGIRSPEGLTLDQYRKADSHGIIEGVEW